ncbi:fatty acyl-CoA reductase wat-like [Vespula squamosa]|uniref:Fatty acyl-CoA reductase wat-like n=1 Tax=Vespula squamosa TaxID=30214 RepID=A0ABD2BS86_VESSQ
MSKYPLIYLFYVYFLHLILTVLIDTMMKTTTTKKKREEFHTFNISLRSRLLEIYKKIHKMSNIFGYFSTVE